MNKIQRLLQEHCPNGVEWKPLGEVAEHKRGTTVTKNIAKEGIYPVISGGQQPAYYIDQFNRRGETITVAGSGAYAGFVMYWNEPIFVGDAFSVKANEEQVLLRYIYHFLLSIQEKIHDLKSGGGVPHVYAKDVARFIIPLPPLPVQQEIVRILDKFTTLEAELEARKKQYEFYRDQLLSYEGKEVDWKPLGKVGSFVRGNGLQKKDLITSGVPAIHYGQIYTYYGTYTNKTKSFVSQEFAQKTRKAHYGDLIIATTSENDEDVCKAVAWLGDGEIAISSDACFYTHAMNPKYVAYYFQTKLFQKQKSSFITGTKVRRVNANDLAKIIIPIPYPNDTKKSLEEQARIVAILDRFDTLVNSISEGLPREIELRKKQYEYYREQLLSFPRHKVTA